ncbi:MAG TPA: RNA 2',3'-cyclic phosphodiesterase [Actinobacteria bacterium]|nr:RNA 2',3'-cyclic phosphodiesterase [Actinomycetes bacterium]HEX21076.1 RNA 2',3'-cyclic phosphodiesterase [Actinomycetota bacterium]
MSVAEEKKRLFIGIRVPDTLRDELSKVKDKATFTAAVRWVETNNLHLTLKFLGDCKPSFVEPLSQKLQSIINKHHSFYLETTVIGSFPSPKRARILWLGLRGGGRLISMQNDIDEGLSEFGYEREEREYHPHITLARFKRPAKIDLDKLNNSLIFNERFKVGSVVLFESRLSKGGAEYSILKLFSLNP